MFVLEGTDIGWLMCGCLKFTQCCIFIFDNKPCFESSGLPWIYCAQFSSCAVKGLFSALPIDFRGFTSSVSLDIRKIIVIIIIAAAVVVVVVILIQRNSEI